MYQNCNIGQTQFLLNYDFTAPKNHTTRLISIFVGSIPQEELIRRKYCDNWSAHVSPGNYA